MFITFLRNVAGFLSGLVVSIVLFFILAFIFMWLSGFSLFGDILSFPFVDYVVSIGVVFLYSYAGLLTCRLISKETKNHALPGVLVLSSVFLLYSAASFIPAWFRLIFKLDFSELTQATAWAIVAKFSFNFFIEALPEKNARN